MGSMEIKSRKRYIYIYIYFFFLNNFTLQRLPTSITKQVIHFKDKINELYEVRMILTILPTR